MYGRNAAPRRVRLDGLRSAADTGAQAYYRMQEERDEIEREYERAASLAYELHVLLTCATETSAAAWSDVREEDGR